MQLYKKFFAADADGDGGVSHEEFIAYVVNVTALPAPCSAVSIVN